MKTHYKTIEIVIYRQGAYDFAIHMTGIQEGGKREHLGGVDVRQEKEATALRTADVFGRDVLLGRDEDVTAERVVIITDSPRQGRHIHHVLETKVVTKKR